MILPRVVSQTWIEGLRGRNMFDKSKRQAAPFEIIPTNIAHFKHSVFIRQRQIDYFRYASTTGSSGATSGYQICGRRAGCRSTFG